MSAAKRGARSPDRRRPGTDRRRPGASRLGVRKTWKLFIGGAFVRSESGRHLVTPDGADNTSRASRKDVRDAVQAALGASHGWASRAAFNRGQILYRLAEIMEGRRAELAESIERSGVRKGAREVAQAIDRVVSYAGWSDKIASVLASGNPVSGPHFGFSVPEPVGVVGIVAPERPSLLGLVGSLCPVITTGNAAVVICSEADPRTALVLAECLATSDLPGGVVNLLTGTRSELALPLARHLAVRALDLWNVSDVDARPLEAAAAENVKRVSRRSLEPARWSDSAACTSPTWLERFLEIKTVWHPMGA